jgi:hypothetical protein
MHYLCSFYAESYCKEWIAEKTSNICLFSPLVFDFSLVADEQRNRFIEPRCATSFNFHFSRFYECKVLFICNELDAIAPCLKLLYFPTENWFTPGIFRWFRIHTKKNIIECFLSLSRCLWPRLSRIQLIPFVVWSKALVCGHLIVGIAS